MLKKQSLLSLIVCVGLQSDGDTIAAGCAPSLLSLQVPVATKSTDPSADYAANGKAQGEHRRTHYDSHQEVDKVGCVGWIWQIRHYMIQHHPIPSNTTSQTQPLGWFS